MKKIIVCMCLALFVGMVYAQEVKYYEDYERGYSGYAGAVYLPRENFDYALNSFSEKYPKVDKMSKVISFLAWRALSQYDIQDGDYNSIMCVPSSKLKTGEVWYVVVEIIEKHLNIGNFTVPTVTKKLFKL